MAREDNLILVKMLWDYGGACNLFGRESCLSCDHHAGGDFRKGYYEIFYVFGEENQQSSHQSKDTYYFSQAQRTE